MLPFIIQRMSKKTTTHKEMNVNKTLKKQFFKHTENCTQIAQNTYEDEEERAKQDTVASTQESTSSYYTAYESFTQE